METNNNKSTKEQNIIAWILFVVSFITGGWGFAAAGAYFGYGHYKATGKQAALVANGILVAYIIITVTMNTNVLNY